MWGFLILTLIWVFVLARVIVYFQSAQISGSWNQHRCDPAVMFTAGMYNTDPTKSNFEFATENFMYCTSQLASSVLSAVFSPVTGALDGLLQGAEQGIQSVGVVNTMASNMFSGLQQILQTLFNRFQGTFLQLRVTLIHLMSAMGRVHAAGIAAVYMGISMVQAFFSAYEFVKKVVMIILGILLALLFLLFFALLPTIPLILAVIAAVGAGGGMASEFCFAADTPVIVADGTTVPISELVTGDVLWNGAKVDAVMEFSGEGVPMYEYDGIYVSGAHVVLGPNGKWMQVKSICDARRAPSQNRLYCLTTSDRRIYARQSAHTQHVFCDYEEFDSPEMQEWWNSTVMKSLGSVVIDESVIPPTQEEGLYPHTLVEVRGRGLCTIETVRISDEVRDIDDYWTKVIGTVQHTVKTNIWVRYGGVLMGSEPIVLENSRAALWKRAGQIKHDIVAGRTVAGAVHLFTETRTFKCAAGLCLRDASEHDGSIDVEYTNKLLEYLNRVNDPI